MPDWVRALFRTTEASDEWHAPQIKSFNTVTYCGRNLEGPLEIAREERAEREGRCTTCVTRLAPPTVLGAAMKKSAVTKAATKPAPKKKSRKAPVAKRSARRSRRETA